MTKTLKQRIKPLQKWSPLLFAFAMVLLIISAYCGPRSLSYVIRALIIGSGFSVLTIAYWKWGIGHPHRLIWLGLSVVLIVGGGYWSKDQTFGLNNPDGSSWSLTVQFVSTVFGVFFAVLSASSQRKHFFHRELPEDRAVG